MHRDSLPARDGSADRIDRRGRGQNVVIRLTLEQIGAALAKLPRNRVPERSDWAGLSGSWTRRIDERMAELERLRAGLTECIGCGCLSLDRCRLANPGDRVARRGAGPRYWIDAAGASTGRP